MTVAFGSFAIHQENGLHVFFKSMNRQPSEIGILPGLDTPARRNVAFVCGTDKGPADNP